MCKQELLWPGKFGDSHRVREFLIEQFVIVGVVDRLQEFLDALAAENPQWLLALINSGSPFNSKQKRRQSGTVIQMQMTNPNRIQVGPIEIFLRHAMRRVGAAIEENRSGFGLKP